MNLEYEELKKQIEDLKEKIDELKIENLELKETLENFKLFSEKVEIAYKEAYNRIINN